MDLHLMEVNMKYKNIKTGVVIETTSKLIGKVWKSLDEIEQTTSVETDESVEEYVEEEIDLEAMTNKELEEFAKKHKIELSYNDKRNKESLINAIAKAFE